MPKKARELSALEVKRLKHSGSGGNANIAVGGVDGLQLQITPTGARSWLLRLSLAGKRRSLGLGSYPSVTLAQARERAREMRDQAWRGEDPLEARRAARRARVTFAEASEGFLDAKLKEFRNEKHKRQWRSTLDTYAAPVLGNLSVDEISAQDVLRVLAPIWETKTETATRVRGRVEAVLSWATVHGHRKGDNPARWKGNLEPMLAKPNKLAKVRHRPALSLADTPAWFSDLRSRDGIATRALEFLALTAARSGEVRGASWSEVDLVAGMWTIPSARMKAEKEHRVPLPGTAVALLDALPRFEGSEFVFTAARGGELSDMSLNACMKRISAARDGGYLDARSGRPAVPHGLRSTFRDWAAERGVERDLAELSLAHVVGSDVERAYRRTDMLERRRQVMDDWAKFLSGGEHG